MNWLFLAVLSLPAAGAWAAYGWPAGVLVAVGALCGAGLVGSQSHRVAMQS